MLDPRFVAQWNTALDTPMKLLQFLFGKIGRHPLVPVRSSNNRPGTQQFAAQRYCLAPVLQASLFPKFRRSSKIAVKGILSSVAKNCQEVLIGLHRETLFFVQTTPGTRQIAFRPSHKSIFGTERDHNGFRPHPLDRQFAGKVRQARTGLPTQDLAIGYLFGIQRDGQSRHVEHRERRL